MKALRCSAVAVLLVAALGPARAALPLVERVDVLVRAGFDRPDEAVAELRQLRVTTTDTPARERLLLQGEALIEAQAGRAAAANALIEQLLAWPGAHVDPLAAVAANIVRALVAESSGQLDAAAAIAQTAVDMLQPGCTPATDAAAPAGAAIPCDYRLLWRARQVLERRALATGNVASARFHVQAAYDVADAAGDAYRKSVSLAMLAAIEAREGEFDDAARTIAQAKRMAAALGDPAAMARVRLQEGRIADARGNLEAALRATEDAHLLAQRAGAVRLESMMLTNLSDAYAKRHRPADALRVASLALPVVRRFNDQRVELALINNSGLAKIGLGRIADGKLDMARVLDAHARRGSIAGQAQTLREFGEALAAAGDSRGGLDLYHRERKLNAEVMASNRTVVVKEMQARYDAEAAQRSIELVRRDNALKSEALANRDLEQRIWTVAAALMLVATVLALLLLRRVRETNRRLAASQTSLRVASQRDPLTQLANRRHFHALMDAARHDAGGFTGALLLVDIDHFKRVNDTHGHAAGDQVLVEVARRLTAAVREEDVVVRWGGEEFLIVAGRLATEGADQLAARILASVGDAPVAVGGRPLRVTASIGYACYPLPPHAVPVPWEQAINLADMALYSAKSQGRNRAVGLVSAAAPDPAAMRAIEVDFERAGQEGRVTLRQTPGP